jgi:type II secretory pathway pseudopilin PulG
MQTKHFKSSNPLRSSRGMTLPEVMVALGISTLTIAGVVAVFMTSSASFVRMGNYITMDMASRKALDQMSRDIRRSKDVLSFSPTQLVFKLDNANNQLIYNWDEDSKQLTQWTTGGETNVLLNNCVWLEFSMWNKVAYASGDSRPQAGFSWTGTRSFAKSVTVAWKCSQSILGKTFASEDMQQGLIVIRNKPVQ